MSKTLKPANLQEILRKDDIDYEDLIYVIVLWIFTQSQIHQNLDSLKLPSDKEGYLIEWLHGDDNYNFYIGEMLSKIGIMKTTHGGHVFTSPWRPWLPIEIVKCPKSLPQCLLVSAVVHAGAFVSRTTNPYSRADVIPAINAYDIFEIPNRFYAEICEIVSRLLVTLLLKLDAVEKNREEFTFTEPIDPDSSLLFVSSFDWSVSAFERCECPNQYYNHAFGKTGRMFCPHFLQTPRPNGTPFERHWRPEKERLDPRSPWFEGKCD